MPEVNYLAVLACGIASMALGFVWYGPLFGKTWAGMMGWDVNNAALMEHKKKSANTGYVVSFIGSLVMAYVLSHMIVFSQNWFDTSFMQAGLSTGFWVWLGFVGPVTLGSVLWEDKSWKLWILNNSYNLLQLLIFGAILGNWR